MEKVQVSQDALYNFLMEHGVKLVRLAELTGLSEASINVCFKHYPGSTGLPRTFTPQAIDRINTAIGVMADDLRRCILKFGSEQTTPPNQRGKSYDPALVEPIKRIGEYMNLTALVQRVLGWSKSKKDCILVTKVSKVYGNISKDDADKINAELLAVAGVLGSYEIVPEEESTNVNC